MLPRITPINPTRVAAPFDGADFLFELKHDGFRAVATSKAARFVTALIASTKVEL